MSAVFTSFPECFAPLTGDTKGNLVASDAKDGKVLLQIVGRFGPAEGAGELLAWT